MRRSSIINQIMLSASRLNDLFLSIFSVLWCNYQLLHPRPHVWLLWPCSSGTSDAEISLVEEIPHHYSDGMLKGHLKTCATNKTKSICANFIVLHANTRTLPDPVPCDHRPCWTLPLHRLSIPHLDAVGSDRLRRHFHHPLRQLLLPCVPRQTFLKAEGRQAHHQRQHGGNQWPQQCRGGGGW